MQRQDAVKLVQKYNKEPFHMQHAFTVEAVMRWLQTSLAMAARPIFGRLRACFTMWILP